MRSTQRGGGGDACKSTSRRGPDQRNGTGVLTMKTIERQCYPGQVHALNLKRGSTLVAKDGALRVEYRYGSLDWLLDAARPISFKLEEGAHHVMPCNAFVKIQ